MSDSADLEERSRTLEYQHACAFNFAYGWALGRGSLIDYDQFAYHYLELVSAYLRGGKKPAPVHIDFMDWVKAYG